MSPRPEDFIGYESKDFAQYLEAVQFIESLKNIGNPYQYEKTHAQRELFLKRTQALLDNLGNPEKGLSIVHITGTAGKGSVSKLVQLALSKKYGKVGLFTSPFTTTSAEKTQINDKYISAKEFVKIVETLKPVLNQMLVSSPYGLPSYFEIFFAIALLHFKNSGCKWAVIEVGLGGRHDATNIFKHPKATAITMIDFDHMHILGNTLKKITWDKAGIIKSGSAFFTTEQRPELVKMMHKICQEKGALFHHLPLDNASYAEANIALASTIADYLGVSENQMKWAVQHFKLPARFETIQHKPLVIVDGAHNPAKIRAAVHNLKKLTYRKLHLIFALGATKDLESVTQEIFPKADFLYATRYLVDKQTTSPTELLREAKKYKKLRSAAFLDPHQALAQALSKAHQNDLVLITGSFYLAGELRKHWYSEEQIMTRRSSF